MKKTLFWTFIILIVCLIAVSAYKQFNKKGAKSSRLECQKEVVVFEKIYASEKLAELKNLLAKQNVKYSFRVEKSKYMESKLFEFVDADKTSEMILHSFGFENNQTSQLELAVLLYENDKLDPGKKSEEAKKYAGYLVFDFSISGVLIYKIQIDFMDMQGKDIEKRVDCAMKSVQSL